MAARKFAERRPTSSIVDIEQLTEEEINSIEFDEDASRENLAKLAKDVTSSRGNTIYVTLLFCYTTRTGEKRPINNVVFTIENCGFPIWKSEYGDHLEPHWTKEKKGSYFTVMVKKSQSIKGYLFCEALEAAYDTVHERLWLITEAFINAGKKKNLKKELEIASSLVDPGGETKKNSKGEEFVTEPSYKWRTEYHMDLDNRAIPKCKLAKLKYGDPVDGASAPIEFDKRAVMPEDRLLTPEMVMSLKNSEANYHYAFSLFKDWYQDYPEVVALCNRRLKYAEFFDALAALVGKPDSTIPDFLTNQDLQSVVFKPGNRLDVVCKILEVAISKEKGSCYSIKANSLRFIEGESVISDYGVSDDDYLNAKNGHSGSSSSSSTDIDAAIAAAESMSD